MPRCNEASLMGKGKWEKFRSRYSPVDISKANTGDANLQLDWVRESLQGRMKINGVPIKEYADQFNGFESEEDVESFFQKVILKDMQPLDKTKADEIVDYLKKSFHQGGFMYPVSSPLAVSMKEYDEDLDMDIPFATVGQMDVSINIVTSKTGFKIQELATIKDLIISNPLVAGKMKVDLENPRLLPKKGSDYVIKAAGTINIDFSNSGTEPSINVENNMISYGHRELAKRMDKRNFGQVVVDFFRNILGANRVKDISPKNEQLKENQNEEVFENNAVEADEPPRPSPGGP